MSFEDKILNQIDRNRFPKNLLEDTDKRERLLKLKQEKVDRFRPDLNEFVDIVEGGVQEIRQDKQEVQRLKEMFKAQAKDNERLQALQEVAEIYEGVLVDQIEANAWFGENCEMLITSEYDDIKNGIDGVGVFRQEGEGNDYLGFGIDVTFASDTEILEKKLNSIKSVIRNEKLPRVKYFVDEDNNHLSLSVPKVIVGSRLSSAEKLIGLWGSKKDGRNQELQQHPVQSKLIM
jgi:vacuolar-type H+-ATPase subunit I/STV1